MKRRAAYDLIFSIPFPVVGLGISGAEVLGILDDMTKVTGGYSSVGRAPALQAGCHRFESGYLHQPDGRPPRERELLNKKGL